MTQNEQFPPWLSMETVPLDKVEFLEYKVYSAQMTEFKNQHLVSSNCQDTLQILFKKKKIAFVPVRDD